jgi:hypothetical protein
MRQRGETVLKGGTTMDTSENYGRAIRRLTKSADRATYILCILVAGEVCRFAVDLGWIEAKSWQDGLLFFGLWFGGVWVSNREIEQVQ